MYEFIFFDPNQERQKRRRYFIRNVLFYLKKTIWFGENYIFTSSVVVLVAKKRPVAKIESDA